MNTEMPTDPFVYEAGLRAPSFILGSVLATYPGDHFVANLTRLIDDKDVQDQLSRCGHDWNSLQDQIRELIQNPVRLQSLQGDFIDIFERGRGSNSLYETEYGRARTLVKGNELLDIAGFYRAFGFEIGHDDSQKDMVDHIAVELEFYALMLYKIRALLESSDRDGVTIVADASRKFLNDHLGRLAPAIASRPGIIEHAFYGRVFNTLSNLIQNEAKRADVHPTPAQWVEGEDAEGDLSCGSLGSCLSGNPKVPQL